MAVEMNPLYLSVKEVCVLLNISQASLYRLTAAGELKNFRVGRKRLFERAALIDWANAKMSPDAPEARS